MGKHRFMVAVGLLMVCAARGAGEDQVLAMRHGEVDVRLFIPGEVKVCRGLMVHALSGDVSATDRWAELCRVMHWAHVAVNIDRKATNRPTKMRAGMDEGLKQFAAQSGHPELVHLPMAGAGMSAGCMVSGVMLKTPERTLTAGLSCGWIIDPAKQPPTEASVPLLFTIGAVNDAFNMVPDVENKFYPARQQGRLWALGFMWECAHDFGPSATFFVPWTKAIAELRVPKDWDPLQGPARLKDLRLEDGWLGDCTTWDTTWPEIAPYGEFKGDKSKAVWLPNRAMAYLWRAFQSKQSPVELNAVAVPEKVQIWRYHPKRGQSMMVDPGLDITLGVTVPEGVDVRKVLYYDGDSLLGESTAAPWTAAWKAPPAGPHALLATWKTADGKPGATTPALVIVRTRPLPPSAEPQK